MEYIYAALMLHALGKKIDLDSLQNVLKAAGVNVDEARAKALVASLEGINIDEVIKTAAVPVAAPTPAAAPAPTQAPAAEKKEEKKEEEKKEEEALAGLAALFG